ncbi:MAG: arginine--tRNA ligase [Clostridiales bacterium]|nr:arginine--tRNA ligase [Clostridiales bacterium]
MDLKKVVCDNIKDIEILKDIDNLYDLLTYTNDTKNGDITLPCFALAKSLRRNPMEIANSIKDGCKEGVFDRVESVNGYLNFYLNRSEVFEVVSKEESKAKASNGKTVFVDFSSLNLAKYMHIGHLSTTVIGSVISNTYEYLGYDVKRLNYVGDYGTPFGKMIAAIKHWGDESEIEVKGVDYIQDLYVKFNVEAESDEALMDEAREWFVKIEDKDPEALRIYDKIIKVSIEEARRLCDILDIKFDSWIGEAYYNDKLDPVVNELEESGLLETSQGAKIVDLEAHDLGVCMIKKSDGASLYATRDLATVVDRYDRYKFDLGLYVTSVQQKLHFARWFKVIELMGKPYANNLKHITYGTYSLPTGKIGSRFGKQALVKDMIDIATDRAREIVSTRGSKVDNIEELSREIGIGAVKFGVLKTERIKDCVFDLESSLNFDGETSPYLQYTHARCSSIIDKASGLKAETNKDDITADDTWELIKHVNDFDRMVESSAAEYEPCYISRYLLTLCSLFNKFYNNHRIIDNDIVSIARLELVKSVREKLAAGLKLLGISAPNAM